MTKRKDKIYFARVNLSGLYDSKPTVLYKDEEYYSSKDGNVCISLKDKKCLFSGSRCIDFWSKNEDEVKLWLKGASAVMYLLQDWSKVNTDSETKQKSKKTKA